MRVSVIIPNLNNIETIERTIDGIHKNAERIAEIIIVDGFSDDGSFELLQKSLSNLDRITSIFLRAKPCGIFSAIRIGVANVTSGHFIVNLGGDKILNLPKMDLNLGELYFGQSSVFGDEGFLFDFLDPKPSFYKMPHINMNSIVWPTYEFKESRFFNNDLKVASDFAMLVSLKNSGIKFCFSDRIKSIFYKDGLSSSQEMLFFGMGEGWYVCLRSNISVISSLYILAKMVQTPKQIPAVIRGFKHAWSMLNDK